MENDLTSPQTLNYHLNLFKTYLNPIACPDS